MLNITHFWARIDERRRQRQRQRQCQRLTPLAAHAARCLSCAAVPNWPHECSEAWRRPAVGSAIAHLRDAHPRHSGMHAPLRPCAGAASRDRDQQASLGTMLPGKVWAWEAVKMVDDSQTRTSA